MHICRSRPPEIATAVGKRASLSSTSNNNNGGSSKKRGSWSETKQGNADVMQFDDDDGANDIIGDDTADDDRVGDDRTDESLDGGLSDGFGARINATLHVQEKARTGYRPVTVDGKTLSAMSRSAVYYCAGTGGDRNLSSLTADQRASDATVGTAAANTGSSSSANVVGSCAIGKFYRNMMHPDIPVALCQACGRFFHEVSHSLKPDSQIFIRTSIIPCDL